MISTYTIIAGNMSCPNNCPICISKMTPNYGLGWDEIDFDWYKFEHATRIAVKRGARNVLITGKGEPTLFPEQILEILYELPTQDFERVELQTEGSNISKNIDDEMLHKWYDAGLDLIAISIYHYDSRQNAAGFGHFESTEVYNLWALVNRLNDIGFLVRISCVLRLGYIDNINLVQKLIEISEFHNVFQLTLRTADVPSDPLNVSIAEYVKRNRLERHNLEFIEKHIQNKGQYCYSLPHGAGVYEIGGQNVSFTSGLGKCGDNRQLIFFPQGWLTTSWETVQGSRIL